MSRRFWDIGAGLLLTGVLVATAAGFWWVRQVKLRRQRADGALAAALREEDVPAGLRAMREGAHPDVRGPNGETLLMLTCGADGPDVIRSQPWQGDPAAVRELLAHHPEVNARDRKQFTPLMYAAGNPHPEVTQMLLAAGADPNARDYQGGTALMSAVICSRPEVVRALLEHGADPGLKDKTGWTALSFAAGRKNGAEDAAEARACDKILRMLQERERPGSAARLTKG
jgi:hypothetical protein